MNSVMKQTTQAALFVKGVCRTASHMAIGPLVAVESFPLQHGSGSRIWAIPASSKPQSSVRIIKKEVSI